MFRIFILLICASFSAFGNVATDITSLGTPSQTHSHGSGLYPAEKAIDGDLTTFNHTESQGIGGAWNLQFPTENEIGLIEIVSRDCCAGRLNGATLRLFDDEAELVYEINIVDGGTLTTFTATIPAGTLARSVRIGFEPTQPGIVHLAEVRVFGPLAVAPTIDQFTSTNTSLTWATTGADSVEISSLGSVNLSGTTNTTPSESTTYLLTASNGCGTAHATTSIQVGPNPILPIINEFSAFPNDWIEIWNSSNSPIDLAGYHLTDNPTQPTQWTFPANTLIPAQQFFVLDAPFGLAREAGSYLALADPSGTVICSFTYPFQSDRGSYGQDLTGNPAYFIEPTPNALNLSPTTSGFLQPVNFSHLRGHYESSFELSLFSSDPILYSLDGSTPSIPYTAPIPISSTTVVRAIATQLGYEPSTIISHTFLFTQDVANQPEFPVGFPNDWLPSTASGALAPIPRRSDYEMDPNIVTSAPFTDENGNTFDIPDALRDLPSICLTLPTEEMWDPTIGLHANAQKRGRDWERPISMEIINSDDSDNFHTLCGLRIHGGRGRVDEMLKKSFRLYFRSDYGASKFTYPLFEGLPENGADHLVLRGGNGKTWASPWRDLTGGGNSLPRVTYLRDQFLRDSNRSLDQPSLTGTFVHLYINGIYWGLYNPVERPGGNYAANHFGGDEDDYDFIKWANGLPPQILEGDLAVWDQLMSLIRNDPSSNWPAIEALVDIDNLADYLISNFYVGNIDWIRNNAYGFRSRNNGKFKFLSWDAEESFLTSNRDSTEGSGNNPDTPLEIHLTLRNAVPEYRLRFADRVHRHLVDEDGTLLPAPSRQRHDDLVSLIDRAISAESARWGDLLHPTDSYTRETDWLTEITNLENNYLNSRTSTTLSQLTSDNLYPSVVAPTINATTSPVIFITSPSGSTYYTLDGSDPLDSPTAQLYTAPIIPTGDTHVLARTQVGSTWSALEDETFILSDPANDLILSEIMYHPIDPTPAELAAGFTNDDQFEYLELRNLGNQDILLDGFVFTSGINATLNGIIPANGYALIVADLAAFESRHGSGHPIVGTFTSGRLDNGGEVLTLVDSTEQTIIDFDYDDFLADGDGSSLTLLNPLTKPNPYLPTSWRSANPTPATTDTILFTGDLSAFLINPTITHRPNIPSIFTITLPHNAENLSGTIELSFDLETWTPASSYSHSIDQGPDNLSTHRYLFSSARHRKRFIRYRLEAN